MRIKTIASLITFALCFTFSIALAGVNTNKATGQNISQFLQNDIRNGQVRDSQLGTFIDNPSFSSTNIAERATTVSVYADASAAMDSTKLPQDFQLAWLKHMRAWHNYTDFLQKPRSAMNSEAVNQLEYKHNHEIKVTWYEVLRVGSKYGASVDSRYR